VNISLNKINKNTLNSNPLKRTGVFCCLKQLNKDTISFKGAENLISQLPQKCAQEFFSGINKQYPEKCRFLLENEDIREYFSDKHGIFNDIYPDIYIEEQEIIKKTIDKLSIDEIKQVFSSIPDRIDKYNYGETLINALILYSNSKEAFEYIVNKPPVSAEDNPQDDLCSYILRKATISALDTVNLNTVKEIEKALDNDSQYDFSGYIKDSDAFQKDEKQINAVHNILEKSEISEDITVYRGDKSSWMLDNIPIDKTMEKLIRLTVFLNPKTRKDLVYPNSRCYSNIPKQSIYEYLKTKEKLTLADAMVCAKYLPEAAVNKILNMINNAEIIDDNFKSYTLDKKFANDWAQKKNCFNSSLEKNMLSILSKTVIKKGNQACYIPNEQYEFILNNNKKNITFSNAQYDRKTNTFFLNSEISPAD